MELSLFIKYLIFFSIAVFFPLIGYFWFYRTPRLIEQYLQSICELLECKPVVRHTLPFYSKHELMGRYHDREVIAGVHYVGLGFEWMPLPYVKIKLRDVIRYNYNRVPAFAYIERGWLVFRIRERLTWGIFDRQFDKFFSREYIEIMLSQLLAIADDAERGKTLEEVFK